MGLLLLLLLLLLRPVVQLRLLFSLLHPFLLVLPVLLFKLLLLLLLLLVLLMVFSLPGNAKEPASTWFGQAGTIIINPYHPVVTQETVHCCLQPRRRVPAAV
jgi:hypothetical protein